MSQYVPHCQTVTIEMTVVPSVQVAGVESGIFDFLKFDSEVIKCHPERSAYFFLLGQP